MTQPPTPPPDGTPPEPLPQRPPTRFRGPLRVPGFPVLAAFAAFACLVLWNGTARRYAVPLLVLPTFSWLLGAVCRSWYDCVRLGDRWLWYEAGGWWFRVAYDDIAEIGSTTEGDHVRLVIARRGREPRALDETRRPRTPEGLAETDLLVRWLRAACAARRGS